MTTSKRRKDPPAPVDPLTAYDRFVHIYDAYTTETGDIAFYRALAREHGGPVLELACGTGRVTLPLARAGFKVRGVDLSAAMLDRLRRRLARCKPPTRERVRLIEGDMRTVDPGRRFPLAILPYSSFLHLLDQKSQLQCLRNIAAHLRPGGVFALDVVEPSPFVFQQSLLNKPVKTDYGISRDRKGWFRTFEEELIDVATQVSTCRYRAYDCDASGHYNGVRCEFTLTMRYTTAAEFRLLFALAGFGEVTLYADFDRRPYDARSGRIVVVGEAGSE